MIDLNTTLFTVENNARTQINEVGGIASGDTTFTVDSVTNFRVGMICTLSDKEYIQNSTVTERVRITGIAGSDLTVTRNIDGTGAGTFADNSWIQGANNAEPIAQLQNILTQKPYIIPVVTGNNLTVHISTTPYDPSNPTVVTSPSPSNPIPVWIGGVLRYITGALSVTLLAGNVDNPGTPTDWFGNQILKKDGLEQDFFAFIGYNTTDGITIGVSGVGYPVRYAQFSTTKTDQNYCKISTITNATANDDYTVIGRFGATLFGAPNFLWGALSLNAENLIQKNIIYSRLRDYTPTLTPAGSMTYTSVTLERKQYRLVGDKVEVYVRASGTTGGTANNQIRISLPFAAIGTTSLSFLSTARVFDNSSIGGTVADVGNTTEVAIAKYDASNFNLGASKVIMLGGTYNIT